MFVFVYSLACEQAKDINVQLCQSLGKTNKISKSRMRKSRKEKNPRYPRLSRNPRPLPECFFKVRCKMSSDAINHELICTEDQKLRINYNLITRRRASKAFYRSPKTTFSWPTFMFLLETISGLIIKIPLIRTKVSLRWGLN